MSWTRRSFLQVFTNAAIAIALSPLVPPLRRSPFATPPASSASTRFFIVNPEDPISSLYMLQGAHAQLPDGVVELPQEPAGPGARGKHYVTMAEARAARERGKPLGA